MSIDAKEPSRAENTETPPLEVRTLVRWLGSHGAKAGLLQSKTLTVDSLQHLAKTLGASPNKSSSRQQLVEEIIRIASRRIDKTIDELYGMEMGELIAYFERVEPTSEELLDVLRTLELTPRKEGHRGLIELAARELSETGRFLRISGSASRAERR